MITTLGKVATIMLSTAAACLGANRTLSNGDQVNWDGTYYDFRAADGKAMVKMWVPPQAKPVRGVFISGHGGGSGDSRNFARDENMKAMAARFGFGLAGLHYFPGGQVYDTGAKRFFTALNEFSTLGPHPELANIPFVIFGSSNGGATTYGFVNAAPERAICFVGNVSARFNPETPVDGALDVPGVFVMGLYDPFCRNEQGVANVAKMLAGARARGARWTMLVEEKGHEDGVAFDVYAKLVEQCIHLRYPASIDPSKGPVKLLSIPQEKGWLVGLGTAAGVVPQVGAYGQYPGDKVAAGWVPTTDMAQVYQAAATRMSPVAIGVQEVGRVYNPNTNPGTMFSIGGPVVRPGQTLTLVCDVRETPDWTRIEFFDGARKLGEAAAGAKPTLDVTVGAEQVMWCLSAMVETKSGQKWPTPPFYFAVADDKIELLSDAEKQVPVYKPLPATGSATAAAGVSADYKPKAGAEAKNVLLAYGLTAEQEKGFGAREGAVAAFWDAIDDNHDAIRMTQYDHAREGSSFSVVTSIDAKLTVKAAHSARGLYLLYDVTDNRYMNADPKQYIQVDALDVLIDRYSSAHINDAANLTQYMNQGWGLFVTTRQYQVAMGGDTVPEYFMRNFADPWDFNSNRTMFADAANRYGIQIRTAKVNRFRRLQEWFIPWTELGIEQEPAVGARLGFAPGYNDRDPDSPTSKELRWIDHTSPWPNGVTAKAPRGWGDIEIGPMIGK